MGVKTENDLLQQVRTAWAEVLELDTADDVPVDTNFLEAGGNSLLLVMLWEELQVLTDRPLRMSDLFEHGTVRAQAALLGGDAGGATELAPIGAGNRGRLLNRAAGAEGTAHGG